jgi:hypothetical protein
MPSSYLVAVYEVRLKRFSHVSLSEKSFLVLVRTLIWCIELVRCFESRGGRGASECCDDVKRGFEGHSKIESIR